MAQLMHAGFVVDYDLEWIPVDAIIRLTGHIFCLGKITIRIEKRLNIMADGSDPYV